MTEQGKAIPRIVKNRSEENYDTNSGSNNEHSPQPDSGESMWWHHVASGFRTIDRHRIWYGEYGWRYG